MRGSEWAPLYLLVVLAIAAILLVTFVKPMFRQAAVVADQASKETKAAAKSLIPLLLWPASFFGRKPKSPKHLIQMRHFQPSQQLLLFPNRFVGGA